LAAVTQVAVSVTDSGVPLSPYADFPPMLKNRSEDKKMQSTIQIECPREILLGLHLDADQFADLIKEEAAMALFRAGKLSSGTAAKWLGIPRAHFLLKAMQEGVSLLENNEDDFAREISLL
jgi:hypothetical protein